MMNLCIYTSVTAVLAVYRFNIFSSSKYWFNNWTWVCHVCTAIPLCVTGARLLPSLEKLVEKSRVFRRRPFLGLYFYYHQTLNRRGSSWEDGELYVISFLKYMFKILSLEMKTSYIFTYDCLLNRIPLKSSPLPYDGIDLWFQRGFFSSSYLWFLLKMNFDFL